MKYWRRFAMISCPLCRSRAVLHWRNPPQRYFRCPTCELVFLDPACHPTPEEEKCVYDLHENDPRDPRYRRFLDRLAEPLLKHLEPGMTGLDFGSGPGPTLSVMLEEMGMQMSIYDPLYAPDRTTLERTYDFVTCSEVVEHFRAPRDAWRQLVQLLRPGGWLGVMTGQVPQSVEAFATWRYRRDPTHLCFHAAGTWRWLAHHHGLQLERPATDIALLRKPCPLEP